ncbi:hypothetical protein F2Q70_00026859 [Brassica cretica]|uniref:Uncharacterized protein n=1 Tax=Brassica cretica TaxID=69181 RepID=A0A8S9LHH2_BRACR|nr:hypothetical protein F2Q70_00026859 [Brassica cretica]
MMKLRDMRVCAASDKRARHSKHEDMIRWLHRNPPQKTKSRTRLPPSKPLPLLGTSFLVGNVSPFPSRFCSCEDCAGCGMLASYKALLSPSLS